MAQSQKECIMLALTISPPALYVYEGPQETEYPVKLDGVITEGRFSVDNAAHRITSQLVGTRYVVAEEGTENAEKMHEIVERLEPLDLVRDEREAVLSEIQAVKEDLDLED